MNVSFKKLELHNFLSYGHSEIDLSNNNFCLVIGENKCPLDRASSNGSGKSSWISGICYALTGETIQGVTKDIKNIYIDEDLCYVKLFVTFDTDNFEITRYNKPKSDLKIVINGIDRSGKGVRDSEIILAQYLPDLNKDLLSSVILLGQGLPNKLTSLSPSNMKQRLEQLSKSDFMIEDVKHRISTRYEILNTQMKNLKSGIVKTTTSIDIYNNQLNNLNTKLNEIETIDFDSKINELTQLLESIKKENNKYNNKLISLNNEYNTSNVKLTMMLNEFNNNINEFTNNYKNSELELKTSKASLSTNARLLTNNISRIKNTKDICPTCHQKIPNIIIPSTIEDENKLKEIENEIISIDDTLNAIKFEYDSQKERITNDFHTTSDALNLQVNNLKSTINELNLNIAELSQKDKNISIELNTLIVNKNNHTKAITELNNSIRTTFDELKKFNDELTLLNDNEIKLQRHIDVVKKMDNLVKRDFRGYLLTNVISYIDTKCKEYSNDILGSNNFDFKIDGNNIEIKYCNKQYSSLSGGEKQKADLIIQFAIRDMLSKHLNFSSNVLVLDEIFDNLDAVGVDNVINLITKKFKDIESIFIISHHSDELKLNYDTTVKIIKNEKGISEIIQ